MKSAVQREHEELWRRMCECWVKIAKLQARRKRISTMWKNFQIEAVKGFQQLATLDNQISELELQEKAMSRVWHKNPMTIEKVAKIQAINRECELRRLRRLRHQNKKMSACHD